jgi:hypothetical protein
MDDFNESKRARYSKDYSEEYGSDGNIFNTLIQAVFIVKNECLDSNIQSAISPSSINSQLANFLVKSETINDVGDEDEMSPIQDYQLAGSNHIPFNGNIDEEHIILLIMYSNNFSVSIASKRCSSIKRC